MDTAVCIDIENLTSIEEIEKSYQDLCLQEHNVGKELDCLLSQHNHLESRMVTLHRMLPNLQHVHADADQLSKMISFTSTLAENVSGKVRQLDLAKSRVTDCLHRVEDILDLKFCTDGVKTALKNESYEEAAAHIHRFLSLDENVLKHTAQDLTEGSTLDSSFNTLHEAKSKLTAIVTSKFDEAVRDEDLASVERFFKIFPLLNQHDEGLKKFSKYLCSQIADTAQKNLQDGLATPSGSNRSNVIYADIITLLFEGIARIIEIHQPLVESYYGPGRLLTVIQILQSECDRQVRRIVDKFKKHRRFQEKADEVNIMLSAHPSTLVERLDPRELDVLLGEVALLNTRAELYLRFIRRRLTNDIEVLEDSDAKKEKLQDTEKLLKQCSLNKNMRELIGQYILMEEYFMKESITKAVNMDVLEEGALTSSMVDDVFFIVKKCLRRALASSSVDGVFTLINYSCGVLESEFCDLLRDKLEEGFPSGTMDLTQAYTVIQSSIQQGKYCTGNESEKARINFLVTMNNCEVTIEYIQTLKASLEEDISRQLSKTTGQEKAKLESCLSDLGATSAKFKELLNIGKAKLSSTAIDPRVKPWIKTFRSTNHDIDEEEFSNYEANDPFVQNLIMNLDGLLSSFKLNMTSNNYDSLVGLLTNTITMQLEREVLKSDFSRLGGLQFDKDLRALVNYLTNVTTWTIRDKFARLTQMATILNLERVDEILEYWGPNSGSLTWRLSPKEVRDCLSLRVDFRGKDDIRRLKL